jgi:hypothetical protein
LSSRSLDYQSYNLSSTKLDKLDKHLKTGGTLSDFESSHTEIMPAAIEPAATTAINQERENFLELIEAIARHIAATRDPLQHLRNGTTSSASYRSMDSPQPSLCCQSAKNTL